MHQLFTDAPLATLDTATIEFYTKLLLQLTRCCIFTVRVWHDRRFYDHAVITRYEKELVVCLHHMLG